MAEHNLKIETVKDNLQIQINQRKALFNNFAAGIFFGVGSAIGASFIFALIIFILGQLDTVPVVGQYIENIIDYLEDIP
jgi:hypothetical protein